MTVCIAAICKANGPAIVGASDRMVTAGAIQYEPPVPKIYNLAPTVVALVAGDAYAQKEVCDATWRKMPRTVAQAADQYSSQLARFNRRQVDRKVLRPLGLNLRTLLGNESAYSPEFVDRVLREMRDSAAGVSTIICGTDATGAHIFTVYDDGTVYCHDSIGFAAVGGGQWHAESQFMFNGYSPDTPMNRALLLVSYAKHRAEVAPGVGYATDVFVIGQQRIDPIPFELLQILYKTNELLDAEQQEVWEKGAQSFSEALAILTQGQQQQPTETPATQNAEDDVPPPSEEPPEGGGP